MKFSAFMLVAAATAAVAVSGEDCPQKKCKSVCTLKGDPHFAKFGEKDSGFLHEKGKNGGKWINMYKNGKTQYRVKVTSNGKNEYVTAVQIKNGKSTETLNAKKHCSKGGSGRKLLAGRMLKEHGVEVKCSGIKKGQFNKVADRKQQHFDVKIHRDLPNGGHKNGRLLASESGQCMGKHTVKCDCGSSPTPTPHPKPHPHRNPTQKPSDGPKPHPHRNPTPKPSDGPKPASPTPKPSDGPSPSPKPSGSCKTELKEQCGTPPTVCYEGMLDNKDCTDFLACVDENHFGKCYKPATCKQVLKEQCGTTPKNCYEGSVLDNNSTDCTDFLACVKTNNMEECVEPAPAPGPEPSPSNLNGTVTCSAFCSAKGDPHFVTYLGEKYKTDAANKTIAMVKELQGFAVEAYVDPVNDKEYITRVSFGVENDAQVMTAEDCNNGTTVQKIDTATLQGTVECAKPKKGFEQYGYHLNVELRQKFTMPADQIQGATLETFAQAMGVMADSECLSGSDDDGIAAMSGEKLAKKFHCH